MKKITEIWTAEETAQFLKLDLRTVYRLVKTGKLPGKKIGKQWRFNPRQLRKLLGIWD